MSDEVPEKFMNLILKALALTLLAYLLPLAVLILGSVGLLTPKGTHHDLISQAEERGCEWLSLIHSL